MQAAARAAEHLTRSGGFGLVVIDLSSGRGRARAGAIAAFPVPLLMRLVPLARTHHAVLLLLTSKSPDTSSVNSLVSLRAEAQWSVRPDGPGGSSGYDVRVRALKDKRRAPGWDHVEACRGSVGMR
jgi:recombination protein RecA